ncbi:nucleolar transcription factor 1-like isoform X2 [Siniperca chuatsi]|uniref:nucleolar transcription factor 1-like isoform X2 n=1 Tax=Siniperca chuatsi TaxID=119488 RepID=UPI001CE0819C|nr:nucleolar transcription factor 1-like isoform X2 [Siniperca chuatsi]
MSGKKNDSEEADWTKANLQKLLSAMKNSIPENDRMSVYTKGLKTVDWNEVAFPPFSPEACQRKWREILQKMRKIRTLTELIVEAEDVIANPVQNNKIHPELPKRPSPPNAIFYEENEANFHQQHPEMSRQKLFKFLIKKYKELPDEEKAQYVGKYKLASETYKRRMLEFRKQYHEPPTHEPRTYRKRKRKRVSENMSDNEQHTEDAEGLPSNPPFNGYNLFCKEQLGSMEGVSKNSYVSVWAQRWRKLTDRQRHEYSKRCRELKTQYSMKLDAYLMTMDEEEQQRILNKYGIKRPKKRKGIKREVKFVKTLPGEPKMPSRSGNVIFCKEQMELLKKEFPNQRERFIKGNQMWHDLSNKEKDRYKVKVYENLRKYSMELQKWFKTLTSAEQEDYRTCNPTKCQYLDAKQMKFSEREKHFLYRPSDSEDEDLEYSSSDKEEYNLDCEEDEEEEEEEEEEEDNMFEMY